MNIRMFKCFDCLWHVHNVHHASVGTVLSYLFNHYISKDGNNLNIYQYNNLGLYKYLVPLNCKWLFNA